MTSSSGGSRRPSPWFQATGALAVAVLSALLWFAWLGWDTTYQFDPVTQTTSGPYEAWQVAGCVLSLLALFVGALLAGVRPLWASAALTLAFTAAWTVSAATTDESGLYAVGTILLLIGLAAGTALLSLLTRVIRVRYVGARLRDHRAG